MVKKELSRRTFVGGTAAIGAAGIATHTIAQETASPVATPMTDSGVPPEFNNPQNWPVQNGNLQSTRVMDASSISTARVDELGLAWSAPISTSSGFGALVGPPVIVDDLVYQQDALSNVHVLSRTSGEVVFTKQYDEAVTSGGPNGVAVGYGKAFYNVGPGVIHAIDALTGDELWQTDLIGPMGEGVCISPLVHANKVYVSTVPGNPDGGMYQPGQRGIFYALDVDTGEIVWEWETVPEDLWGNPEVNSGGGLWQPPTVDGRGNVYLSVANAAPFPGTEEFPNTSSRPGENPYTNHLVSLNEETGELNWAYSITGHDMFDLDHHLAPISTTLTINGEERPVILSTGKHAIVVCADAETGEEYWRNPIGVHQNDDVQEIEDGDEIEVYPGSQGGNQMPFAYKDGVLFIAHNIAPSYFTTTEYTSAIPIIGTEGTGIMFALDATTGDVIWEAEIDAAPYGGALVMNDIVFTAALDGIVRGFDTASGERVFTYQTSAGVNAPLSASGDYLIIAAGTVLTPRSESVEPLPEFQPAVIALTIGGEAQAAATPETESTPVAEEATPEDTEATVESTPEEEVVTEQPTEAPVEGTPETEGDAGAGAGTEGSTPAAGAVTTDVLVTTVDIAFEPTSLAIPAETDVTVTVSNEGMLQHDFVIEGTDYSVPLLNGGESADVVVNLPAGEYVYYCSVAGHREAGMEGTLTVGA